MSPRHLQAVADPHNQVQWPESRRQREETEKKLDKELDNSNDDQNRKNGLKIAAKIFHFDVHWFEWQLKMNKTSDKKTS